MMDILPADILSETLPSAVCEEQCVDCPAGACLERLRDAGLRPTRQRRMLGDLLFSKGDRHVTAELLYAEAVEAEIQVSLATVYNTLNQFTQAGLLRRIGPDGSKSFFDTNTSVHPHFYLDGDDILIDVPESLALAQMPEALPGHEISRLDIIIHIRRKQSAAQV
ncbi:Fur family transcriptional regulator Irr [Bradyrhizobium cenepequi]